MLVVSTTVLKEKGFARNGADVSDMTETKCEARFPSIKSVLHIITGLQDGGAEGILFQLCTHDKDTQHHVVSLMDAGKYGPLLAESGICVTCLNMPRGKVSISGIWRLFKLIRKLRPDFVQTWMYHADLFGGVVARLSGHRNIAWGIHNTALVPGASSRSSILVASLCARLSGLLPRKIICCAERAREAHCELGYDPTKMLVIPNGYDLSVFRPDPLSGQNLRAELAISADEHLIGFVARFDPMKDHDGFLRALALLKKDGKCPRCLLVGSGMDASNIKLVNRIAELGLDALVLLLGRRSDIPAVMNALDLHVMSSIREAFPNVLAEAMACGTPCVSTEVGDAPVIVGQSGRIVPPGEPAALARAISDLLIERDRPDWAARCDQARRHVAEHFSVQRMVDGYRNVWETENKPLQAAIKVKGL